MASSKSYSLAVCILAASLGVAGPALAQSSIGFVSLERILREAPAVAARPEEMDRNSRARTGSAQMAEQLRSCRD